MNSKKTKILLVCGGPSGEHEISLASAKQIENAINTDLYETTMAVVNKDLSWTFPPDQKTLDMLTAMARIKASNFDLVFIAIHGAFGEDGQLQSILDSLNIPYVGSSAAASSLAMDKFRSMAVYEKLQLKIPPTLLIRNLDQLPSSKNLDTLGNEFVIKPNIGGSSIGVIVAQTKSEAIEAIKKSLENGGEIIVQELIKGKELTCGVLELEHGKPFALPPTEIVPKLSGFFDYHSKYTKGASKEITPANLPQHILTQIQEAAIVAHEGLNCFGMSRSDFILDEKDILYILETNTLPGMTETSLLPQGAKVAGINFDDLVEKLIQSALNRTI